MRATRDQTRQAVNGAVREAFSEIALLTARPCEPSQARGRVQQGRVLWSWIRILDPVNGVMAVAMPMELATEVAHTVCGTDANEIALDLVLDAQRELTNIIAGRTLAALAGKAERPRIDLPSSGNGAPDVRRGDWMGQTFAVDESWLAVFVQSTVLLLKDLDAMDAHAHSAEQLVRSDQLTRAAVRVVHHLPSGEFEIEKSVAASPTPPTTVMAVPAESGMRQAVRIVQGSTKPPFADH